MAARVTGVEAVNGGTLTTITMDWTPAGAAVAFYTLPQGSTLSSITATRASGEPSAPATAFGIGISSLAPILLGTVPGGGQTAFVPISGAPTSPLGGAANLVIGLLSGRPATDAVVRIVATVASQGAGAETIAGFIDGSVDFETGHLILERYDTSVIDMGDVSQNGVGISSATISPDDNTAAGAVGSYTFINLAPFVLGAGASNPTSAFFLLNKEPTANSSLLGKFTIGKAGIGGAELTVYGPDTSFGTWIAQYVNAASLNVLILHGDGTAAFGGPITAASTVTANDTVSAPAYTVTGGTTPTAATGAGTGGTVAVAGNQNAQVVTLTTGTTPAANATAATISLYLSTPLGAVPVVSPGNSTAAAVMDQVWVAGGGASSKTYTINLTTALTAATTYIFNVQTVCSG